MNSNITVPATVARPTACAVFGSIASADLNGDGSRDFVLGDSCGYVRAYTGLGTHLWTAWTGYAHAQVAIGDVDNDGKPEVVSQDQYHLRAYNGEDGSLLWSPVITSYHYRTAPMLADIDHDGRLEIVVGGNAYNGESGSTLWARGAVLSDAHGSSVLGDVKGDGSLEVVGQGHDCYVRAADGATGTIQWATHIGCPVWNSVTRPSPALVDITGDGKLDVFAIGSYSVNALDGVTGALLWSKPLPASADASPVVGDLDGDGIPELIVNVNANGNVGSKVLVLDATTGREIWTYTVTHGGVFYNLYSTPVILDVDNDGVREVVFGASDGRLYAVSNPDARTVGTVRWYYHLGYNIRAPPAVVDLNGDGGGEILFGSDATAFTILVSGEVVDEVPVGGERPGDEDVDATPPRDDVSTPTQDDVDATAPNTTYVEVELVSGVVPGDDADGDGVPANVTLATKIVAVHRDDPANATERPGPSRVLAVDPDDANPKNPGVPDTVSVDVARGVELADTTGDGVPDALVVRTTRVSLDRNHPENGTTLGSGSDIVVPFQPDLPSTVRAEVPRGAELRDLDGDGVPDVVFVHTMRVRADRNDPSAAEFSDGRGITIRLTKPALPANVPSQVTAEVPFAVELKDTTGDQVYDVVEVRSKRVTVTTSDPMQSTVDDGSVTVIPLTVPTP